MNNLLLVDDSPSDRAVFRTILKKGGFAVHEVAYGRDALPVAQEIRPLVVVLDVNLPDTDGHSVCRLLKADPILYGTPVLMLTIRDDQADVIAGLEAGADDYVPKDSAPEILLARVQRLARDRQLTMLAVLNEQMAQIGRLLAGIVHEIRAPLAVIRGNADLLRMLLSPDHEAHRHIEPILRNCQVLQLRLEHLMATVRGGPPVLRPTDIGPVVREAADLFIKGTDPRKGKLKIGLDIPENLPLIQADGGRIIQVIMNLLGNAHDALASGPGEARVAIKAQLRPEADPPSLTVEVADNGPGIPDDLIGRIFEPFFTTKSSGSGYGLYLASQILREHGGRLTVANLAEGGAVFTLWFPLEPRDAPKASQPGNNSTSSHSLASSSAQPEIAPRT